MKEISEGPLLVEVRGAVALLTLNRPEVRNAIDHSLAEAIGAAIDELDGAPEIRAGVMQGAGKGFCAGMDLKAFTSGGKRPWTEKRGFAGIVRLPPVTPMVAAVEGFAVAGGLEVALSCDLLVAAAGAKLGIPEVKRSLVAAGGALRRLPQRLPHSVVMEMALTGDPITAERGYELGLVNRVAEPGGAGDAAIELAEAIAANGPLALAATKEILVSQPDWDAAEFWQHQDEISGPVFVSEDATEGATAFAEKRDPLWRGK